MIDLGETRWNRTPALYMNRAVVVRSKGTGVVTVNNLRQYVIVSAATKAGGDKEGQSQRPRTLMEEVVVEAQFW